MSLLHRTRTRIAAVAVAAVAVAAAAASGAGFAGVSAVTAGPATASAVPATTVSRVTAAHHGAHPWIGRLLARTDHATVEVKRHGTWVTLELDRGKVTAASATSVSLARPDGTSVTIAVTPATKVRGVSSAAALVIGHRARVVSLGGDALLVGQHTAGSSATKA